MTKLIPVLLVISLAGRALVGASESYLKNLEDEFRDLQRHIDRLRKGLPTSGIERVPEDEQLEGKVATFYKVIYRGTWSSLANFTEHQFSFFDTTTGKLKLGFLESDIGFNLLVKQYEGQYSDGKVLHLQILLRDFHLNESTTLEQVPVYYMMEENYDILETKQSICSAKFTMTARSHDESKQLSLSDSVRTLVFDMELIGHNCTVGFRATVQVDTTPKKTKAIGYACLVSLIVFLETYCIYRIIRRTSENEVEANKLSLMSISLLTIWDAFLCLLHLYLALSNDTLFYIYLGPAFLYFVLLTLFQMRLLNILWKARYYTSYQSSNHLRRGIVCFYLRFYIAKFVFLLLLFQYFKYSWVIVLAHTFLIPQLIHNALRGLSFMLDTQFIFGVVLPRILIPLYFRGCPVNNFETTPSPGFCATLFSVVGAQIVFYLAQQRCGPRFFIPKCLLPPKHNYYISVRVDLENMEDDCAICMNSLYRINEEHQPSLLDKITVLGGTPKGIKLRLMKTPCKHSFHVKCLTNWMGIKMECPSCRAALPPV